MFAICLSIIVFGCVVGALFGLRDYKKVVKNKSVSSLDETKEK